MLLSFTQFRRDKFVAAKLLESLSGDHVCDMHVSAASSRAKRAPAELFCPLPSETMCLMKRGGAAGRMVMSAVVVGGGVRRREDRLALSCFQLSPPPPLISAVGSRKGDQWASARINRQPRARRWHGTTWRTGWHRQEQAERNVWSPSGVKPILLFCVERRHHRSHHVQWIWRYERAPLCNHSVFVGMNNRLVNSQNPL